jgi:hypothetical protein
MRPPTLPAATRKEVMKIGRFILAIAVALLFVL